VLLGGAAASREEDDAEIVIAIVHVDGAIMPGEPATRINRALVALDWRADIKPFQTMLATLVAEDPSVARFVDDPELALCERTVAAASRFLMDCPRDGVVNPKIARALGSALWMYDLTGGARIGKLHRRISKDRAIEHMPTLRGSRLTKRSNNGRFWAVNRLAAFES
jgi:hypothetical protein